MGRRGEAWKQRGCASISRAAHGDALFRFHAGTAVRQFLALVVDPLWVAGFSDTPGSVRGILGLWSGVTSAASFRWVLRGNFFRTAGAASISPLEVGPRHPRSAVRRSGGPCVKVPVTMQALRRSSPCEVGLRHSGLACSEFLTTGQAVCRF
ncbi:hypothetical protein NDU88_002101 [Pleurodeles waltl]|uniref:Uncharacterized protein n=1 Tax=Pleurodeles waltl TaxID=8319 RepID=A0AAV7U8R0_PLEWA|nr:hypothetical protein NDU88_002101 [Pleurodeles waltl]